MFAYLTILSASLAGFAGVQPWAIAVAAIFLSSLSYVSYRDLYQRGQELSLTQLIDEVIVRSIGHSVVAAGLAYGFGWLLKII